MFDLTKSAAVPLDRKAIGGPVRIEATLRDGDIPRVWIGAAGGIGGSFRIVPFARVTGRGCIPPRFLSKLAELCIQLHGRLAPVVNGSLFEDWKGGRSGDASRREALFRF